MHDMRHAEMLGRTIVRLGALPSLQMKTLPPCRTYRDLLVAARKLEEEKLARYGQHLYSFSDKEIYLLISNIMRENEIHAALDDQLIRLLETEGMADRDIPPTQGQGQVAGDVSMLQRAFYLEAYSIINLIYLSICLGPDQSLSPRLRGLAIEHMVHLNNIGHEIQDLGALPQVPLQIDFIGSDQFSVQALLEKNIRIMQQKAEEMGSFLPRFQNEKGRNTLGTIIPKELENASDLQAYLGSLNSVRAVH
jgi:bacterioferritin (cytochrome b1)